MLLTPVVEKYIVHWGEMGTRWGVNRTVAQIHALLYLAPDPLTAEEITGLLGVARSNVSTSLKELQSWGLVKVEHVLGDRRDHFVSMKEIWDIFDVIVEERKRREIDPTVTLLRECVLDATTDTTTPPEIKERIFHTLEFMEMLTGWYDQMKRLPRPALVKLMSLGARIESLLGRKEGVL